MTKYFIFLYSEISISIFDNTFLQTQELKKTKTPKHLTLLEQLDIRLSGTTSFASPPRQCCFKISHYFHTLSSVLLPGRISTWIDTVSTMLFLLESLSSSRRKTTYLTFCVTVETWSIKFLHIWCRFVSICIFNPRSSILSFGLLRKTINYYTKLLNMKENDLFIVPFPLLSQILPTFPWKPRI